jgi:hypothetical protein
MLYNNATLYTKMKLMYGKVMIKKQINGATVWKVNIKLLTNGATFYNNAARLVSFDTIIPQKYHKAHKF